MLDYLDTLRTKPIYVRKRIAFVTTAVCSLVITIVWWNSWNAHTISPPVLATKTPSPWNVVLDTFNSAKMQTASVFESAVSDLRSVELHYTPAETTTTDLILPPMTTKEDFTTASRSGDEITVISHATPGYETIVIPEDVAQFEAIHNRPKTVDVSANEEQMR